MTCTPSARCGSPGCPRCGFGPPVPRFGPAKLASLANLAELVRHMRWDVVDAHGPNDVCIDGIEQRDDVVSYDGLPVELRTVIEAVPGLIRKIERLEKGVSDEPAERVG